MIQSSMKNWLLLALCGVLDAVISVIYLNHVENGFHAASTVVFLGKLTLAGGALMIAAGIWTSENGKRWLLVMSGLACSSLGLIFTLWTGPLSFRTVALLIVVMAMSIGIYELAIARTFRHHIADELMLGAAGVVSVGFALAFLAFVFRWIKLEPGDPGQSLRWMGSYFGFCAICMLGLALRYSSTRVKLVNSAERTP